MIKVLFICHGNICRSPMAEFIMKKMVRDCNLENEVYVASAATSYEEIGNPVYPPAKKELEKHGILCNGKKAMHLEKKDYEEYDYLIAMEQYNITNVKKIIGSDHNHKVYRLLDFTNNPQDIADPWYTGNFDLTYQQIEKGCQCLLSKLFDSAIHN